MVKCNIKVNRIFFPKNTSAIFSNSFVIFSATVIDSEDYFEHTIKLKGEVPFLNNKDIYTVEAELEDSHPVYGDNYRILSFKKLNDNNENIENSAYNILSTFINENLTEKIIEEYPNILNILDTEDIESLTKIKGIGSIKALKIIEKYKETSKYNDAFSSLYRYGLSKNLIIKIVDYYKNPKTAIQIIKENPFVLTEITGIGFKKADEIANKIKIENYEEKRNKGFIIYTLNENGEKGLSFLQTKDLLIAAKKVINITENELNKAIKELKDENILITLGDGYKICLKKYYDLEKDICKELIRLYNGYTENNDIINDVDSVIEDIEKEIGFELAERQKQAIILSTRCSLLAITGLAGTGKTTIAYGICKALKAEKILGIALSGKASVRMAEATGVEPSTIHKALKYKNGKFFYNEKNRLDVDLVLIDEATMINGTLFLSLLKAIPDGATVVMLGDIQQLTPIGNCNVFSDILKSNVLPSVRLTEPHRQALESGIIPFSIQVANQIQIFNSSFKGEKIFGKKNDMKLVVSKENDVILEKIIETFEEVFNKNKNILETQILSPMRIKGTTSCYAINTEIQKLYNPSNNEKTIENIVEYNSKENKKYILKIGDKVINTRNNYNTININGEETPIFNGNIGIIKEIENDCCIIDFIGIGEVVLNREQAQFVELAYAISVHKSQGSGFNDTIVVVDNGSYVLNNTELLYTAITRAKQNCILIGTNKAIRYAIQQKENFNKKTLLKDFIYNNQNQF